ncbi:Isotrichodermin C-15 hydroxylase [Cyphellophora attinorum]|uniref:Isotrichodermin C-15 hydroxylase n=1 Tax=Cyphellophora attinorum TaxID=1664694 RepID=A0A0N0NN13_9EURO|nr:Isotrichodermin C-15 hydroxylase [Phialophora attinorum]KPI40988.1 Isotrichodermin C-15 hydroxylase [Phialophora attinorum]
MSDANALTGMAQGRSITAALTLLAVASIGLVFAYTIALWTYNLFFHPLAKFPGPRLNAMSPIPGIYSLLRGRLPLENKQLHDKYGPVVRVSPNELAFNSAQAWEDIYGHRQGRPNMHKDPIHVGSVDPLPGATTLTMADDDNHARQRRALAHSFSTKALMEQEDIIQGYVSSLIKNLGKMADRSEEFNMVNWLNFTTFDIIGDLAFGDPFGCLELGAFHSWVALIYETVKVGALEQATRRFSPAGTWLQSQLLNMIPQKVRQRRRDHLTFSREKVLRRLADDTTQHKDFIHYIVKQREKHDLQDNEIVLNGALFIVAGSETTANLLSGLIARLLWNPDKYEKLVAEIRSSFGREQDITYDATSNLVYLNACLEEGLRIHPPVPTGLLRTVPKGGDYIDGNWVPSGTSVAVSSWAAAHNPVNFKDCDSFIPERFIDPEWATTDNKKAYQPFSLGPRGCIGKNLSYMEMRLILTRVLWNFDIKSVDGAWQWDPKGEMGNMRAFMTWEKPDLNCTAVRVKR